MARAGKRDGTGFVKAVVFANGLLPLALLVWDAWRDQLGANPIDYVTRATGTLTLLFLALTLAVTPLWRLSGWGTLNKLRRIIGLFAFFYGTLHLATYVLWDQELMLRDIVADVLKRRFVLVGAAAWLLMVPLAITSTNGMAKRLGKSWKRLHRLTYAAAGLGVLHFYMLLKVPNAKLWNYGIAIALLLAARPVIATWRRGRSSPASRAPGAAPTASPR